jgi:hypothetical protein
MITLGRLDTRPAPFDYARGDVLFTCHARIVASADTIGPTPEGIGISFALSGGEVRGSRISGRLRPIGSDWVTVRPDGNGDLDLRIAIETHDGALVYAACLGSIVPGTTACDHAANRVLPAGRMPFRVATHLHAPDDRHEWLHQASCIVAGHIDFDRREAVLSATTTS